MPRSFLCQRWLYLWWEDNHWDVGLSLSRMKSLWRLWLQTWVCWHTVYILFWGCAKKGKKKKTTENAALILNPNITTSKYYLLMSTTEENSCVIRDAHGDWCSSAAFVGRQKQRERNTELICTDQLCWVNELLSHAYSCVMWMWHSILVSDMWRE